MRHAYRVILRLTRRSIARRVASFDVLNFGRPSYSLRLCFGVLSLLTSRSYLTFLSPVSYVNEGPAHRAAQWNDNKNPLNNQGHLKIFTISIRRVNLYGEKCSAKNFQSSIQKSS